MANYEFHTYAPDAMVYDPNTGTFTLDANYDYATDRNLVQYSDDDSQLDGDENFDGVGDDANQVGTAYDDAGNVIASGTVYASQYAQLQAPDGSTIYLDRIEVDGVHVGYISSAPLQPGTQYSVVDTQRIGATADDGNSNTLQHGYYQTNSVPCFAAGTIIDTMQGMLPVEQVKVGMALRLLDGSSATVMWRRAGTVPLDGAGDDLHPILISKDAIAPGQPSKDLAVSPQHRIVVGHAGQWAHVPGGPALVPARALLRQPGIRVMRDKRAVTWVHLACRHHHVINVQGCLTETMLLGPACLRGLPALERLRLTALFAPAPKTGPALNGPPAYPCLSVHAGRRIMDAADLRV